MHTSAKCPQPWSSSEAVALACLEAVFSMGPETALVGYVEEALAQPHLPVVLFALESLLSNPGLGLELGMLSLLEPLSRHTQAGEGSESEALRQLLAPPSLVRFFYFLI